MRAPVQLESFQATHLFEAQGTLERVAQLAVLWCRQHLTATER
jgi:hypothetical protein